MIISIKFKKNKMKSISKISLFATLFAINILVAQQDPNFTLYNFNMNIINPAYAGSNDTGEINLSHRSQWIGIDNAPSTQTLSYSTPLKNNLGLGISIINDKVFVLSETDVAVDVSYKLKISETHNLFFGAKFGGGFVNIDLNNAGAPGNDPLYAGNQSFFNSHIGAGLYLKNKNYYVTVSTPNFLKGKRYEKQGNTPIAAVNNLHMYYGAGYHFKVSETVKITPSFMYRGTEGAPSSADINTTVDYNNIKAGMNYRLNEAYSIFTLFNMTKKIRFGAAYDFTTSEINEINNNGSIEMLIRYKF
jgi:type IX secretion system PorP/SprF family membrane protein